MSHINTHISIEHASMDSISAHLNRFSASESKGFKLNDLSFNVGIGKKQSYIKPIEIRLPNSKVTIDELSLKYDSLQ